MTEADAEIHNKALVSALRVLLKRRRRDCISQEVDGRGTNRDNRSQLLETHGL